MKEEIYGGSEHAGHEEVCAQVKDAEERDEVELAGRETGEKAKGEKEGYL